MQDNKSILTIKQNKIKWLNKMINYFKEIFERINLK
jgi:hypothetical protein